MITDSCPIVYTVAGLRRITVAAAVLGVPGTSGQQLFRFPSSREITGVLVLPATGDPVAAAGLSLDIVDEDNEPIFTDMQGDERLPRLPFAAPCLSLSGFGFHPWALRRLVASNDVWRVRLRNLTAGAIDVASVTFHHRALP